MKKSRIVSTAIAAMLAANSMLCMPFSTGAAGVKVEAETGTLTGTGGVKTEVSGFSGDGYMFLEDNGDVIDIPVTVETAGMYTLTVCYQNNFGGDKIQNIVVNGVDQGQMSFPENAKWSELTFGNIKLDAGENTVTIKGSWGWTNFDYIMLEEASLAKIEAKQTATCDPDAIDNAKKLMTYLASVYGEHILSGQQEIYQYGPHDLEYEFEYIKEKTGKLPAIRGFDYGNFTCPAFGSPDGSTDRIIKWAEQGGIATASWHLNVPTDFASYEIGSRIAWDQTTYTQNTDFSPSKAATEGTKENQYYTQALDTLADEFLILQEKGIPVLWRPLHEAEGGGGENGSWFWWGREGSKAYRELYIYTYKYLTEKKGCHNLIWEFNSYNYSNSENWYPGDAYVDIIGYDKYNCTDWSTGSAVLKHNDSAISSTFYGLMEKYNSAKMIAMTECDSFSTVENLTAEKAGWLYFMPWYDGGSDDINFLSNPVFNTEKDLIDMYTSDYCITLDELPNLMDIEIDPDATNDTLNTQPTEPEAGHAMISVDDKGNFNITFPEVSDTYYLVVETDPSATYTNGGLGCTVEVDGNYYWANTMWVKDSSGDVKVDPVKDLLNVTLTVDGESQEIKDEAILDQIKEKLADVKSFQGQVWYTAAGEVALDNSTVTIVDGYVKGGSEGTTDPKETETTETTESTTTETTETTTETTETSENPTGSSDVTLYGDVAVNGKVELLDVIELNKNLLGMVQLDAQGMKNADVNNDKAVDGSDSLLILKSLVSLVTLPYEEK
ncbi:MAG: glycoside hydrolase [Oscillospiraceae bacterium]|nr:glycoside hydrolase [Oscillospiraceae bacterium]